MSVVQLAESPCSQFLDELLTESRPVPEVVVTTASNKTLKFRQLMSYDEMLAFREETQRFVKVAKTAPHISWKDLVPKSRQAIASAFTIHYLSVEPKISVDYAFRIVNEAPYLAEQIISELAVSSSEGVHKLVAEAMDQEGKDSGVERTSSGEIFSSSAESISQEPTPTD